jgi:hypothetical protein
MTEYYRLNGQTLSYAEYWRMSPGIFAFAMAALLKLLHCPVNFAFSIPRPEALTFMEPADIPGWVQKRWQRAVETCQDWGLQLQFCYTLPVLERHREAYAASFLSGDGLVGAAVCAAATRVLSRTTFSCLSRLRGGYALITTDQRKQLEPHPDDQIVRLPGAAPDVILERHLRELGEPERTPWPVNGAEWPQYVLEREQRHVDYHIVRGVYVPMTAAAIERILEQQERSRPYRER